MVGKCFKVELFIQGLGWSPFHKYSHHSGVVSDWGEAVKLALGEILSRMKMADVYGVRVGELGPAASSSLHYLLFLRKLREYVSDEPDPRSMPEYSGWAGS